MLNSVSALKAIGTSLYNAANALTEVDRLNNAGVLTEADVHNPSTRAAIGSYLYGSGGVVNEVVDLVNTHHRFPTSAAATWTRRQG